MKTYLFLAFIFVNGIYIFGENAPLNYYILEELPQFTLIGNIPIDAKLDRKYTYDVLKKLKFNFLGQTEENKDLFKIKEETGIIRTGKKIDRDTLCPQEESCSIDLDVVIKPVEYFEIIKMKINILDINDHTPKFPTETLDFQISESSMPGASFSIPSASDPDSSKYSIKGYSLSSTSAVFDLKVTNGPDGEADLRLVLRQSLDREKVDFYQMQVVASDGDSPAKSGNVTVNIHIKDANDNNPIFTNNSYEVDIKENAPYGTTFLQVTATDPDDGVNGEINYLFAKHTINLYGNIFGINGETGGLYLKGALDYETTKVYTLSLRAYDKGQDSTPAQATVLVRVKDVNDNAPQISVNTLTHSGEAEVTENSDIGTFVAHISILDPDNGENGIVTCTLNDTRFNLKQLFKTEYKIITTEVFDREKQAYIVLALRCSDMGIPAQVITQIMMVNILDENDNRPLFTHDVFQGALLENSPVGTPVLAINASDSDDGENSRLSYHLHSDAGNKFLINSFTGTILSHTKFDYEIEKEVRFHVLVRDNGKVPYTSTAEVVLEIKDTDDEKPEFLKDNYFFRTVENQPVGTVIGKVTVNDADSQPYNQFYISWDDTSSEIRTAREHFDVDPISGTVSLKKVLDREVKGLYQFGLKAVSKTSLNFADTTFVTVYVEDQNDNRPLIAFPRGRNNTIHVWINTPIHSVIGRILASDKDNSENGKLVYNITQGDKDHIFDIDQETGALTLAKLIPSGIGTELDLKIAVHDKGKPSLSSYSRLTVIFTSEQTDSTGWYASSRSKKAGPAFDLVTLVIVATLGGLAGLLIIVVVAAIVCLKKRKNSNKGKNGNIKEKQLMLNHGQGKPILRVFLCRK